MIEAITYQNMLKDISSNQVVEDTIGILLTRPDLDVGKSILNSLNYYHHLSSYNMNFYLPGYGAYWYETYPDGRVVTQIDGIDWYFSDKMFVSFISELEKYSKWEYSGESELLMLEYKGGILSYDNVMQFYLDNMMRDGVIVSIPSFFQQLFKLCKRDEALKSIRNTFVKGKLVQVTTDAVLHNIPKSLADIFIQEKYFRMKNCSR